MTFNKEVPVARNCTAAQIAIKVNVGTFHKLFREVLKCGLHFRRFGSFNFWHHLRT